MDPFMNLHLTFAERLPLTTLAGIVASITLGVCCIFFGQNIPPLW
jgi:hypothetical protein